MFLHLSYAAAISIHVPRMGDDVHLRSVNKRHDISIHVPRAGDDPSPYKINSESVISIHVPRAGDDTANSAKA